MPELPEWWEWPFVLTLHAALRMEERGLHEIELRSVLNVPDRVEPDRQLGRWRATGRAAGDRWTIVLEPDPETGSVLVITVFRT